MTGRKSTRRKTKRRSSAAKRSGTRRVVAKHNKAVYTRKRRTLRRKGAGFGNKDWKGWKEGVEIPQEYKDSAKIEQRMLRDDIKARLPGLELRNRTEWRDMLQDKFLRQHPSYILRNHVRRLSNKLGQKVKNLSKKLGHRVSSMSRQFLKRSQVAPIGDDPAEDKPTKNKPADIFEDAPRATRAKIAAENQKLLDEDAKIKAVVKKVKTGNLGPLITASKGEDRYSGKFPEATLRHDSETAGYSHTGNQPPKPKSSTTTKTPTVAQGPPPKSIDKPQQSLVSYFKKQQQDADNNPYPEYF